MNNVERQSSNRRRHERYLANETTYVRFHKSDELDFRIVGQVIDVSSGGLAFRYMEGSKNAYGKAELTIYSFAANREATINIPCEVVYDSAAANKFFFEPLFRRCGIKFTALSAEQESQLQNFIQNCTN